MMHLWEAGAVRQADLIDTLGVDPSTMTKMLQRLQRTGNVTRTTDPADRRASSRQPKPAEPSALKSKPPGKR